MPTKIRHASHSGYSHGCRCTLCKEAHRIYERNAARRRRRIRYGLEEHVERFVDATEAREHILFLASRNVGLGSVAKRLNVHRSNMQKIKNGQTKRISPELSQRILAIPSIHTMPYDFVPTDKLRPLINMVYEKGYTMTDIARAIGIPSQRMRVKRYARLYRFNEIEKACNLLLKASR